MANIIIYGTDSATTKRLSQALRKETHRIQLCDISDLIPPDTDAPALILLDARLKWAQCRPLLEQIQPLDCAVLFYTTDKHMISHLRALYTGPCDVLVLPFSAKTLTAKVAALLEGEAPLGKLAVDEKERVALLDGERVELTAQECTLLLTLMESADMPVSREQLLYKAWGYQSMGETRTVDVHVQRLRKKLGGERIETVYKCGYRLKMA